MTDTTLRIYKLLHYGKDNAIGRKDMACKLGIDDKTLREWMQKAETKKLLEIVAALYPSWKPDNLPLTVEAWSAVLADEDAQTMANALKFYAERDDSGFAPTTGQLLKYKPSAEMRVFEAKLIAKQYDALPGGNGNESALPV